MAYCTTLQLPGGGTAIVRHGVKLPVCKFCGKGPALTMCDWPDPTRRSKTCDARLCAEHAQPQPDGADFCPTHKRAEVPA